MTSSTRWTSSRWRPRPRPTLAPPRAAPLRAALIRRPRCPDPPRPPQNQDFLKELKFGIGDGHLQFYLYNYYVAGKLKPQDVGLVLL